MDKEKLLNHELVPKHEILPEKEAEKVLKKYGITKKELPKVKSNDPVIKAIEAEEGDVIEITRDSPTAGETKYYRVVIPV
ncbi:MAG: DNA-directed RNA polymerase subunit H [archaeon]